MHLAGELNISNSGLWGLIPDTVFYDSKDLVENGLDSKGKYLNVSRILPIKKLEDLTTTFPRMVSLLSREAYGEVVFDNLIGSIFNKAQYNLKDVESLFTATLLASSIARSYLPGGYPVVTITIPADDLESNIVAALLNGYRRYVENTPVPRIGVQITCQDYNSILMHSEVIGSIGLAGGMISVSNKGVRTHTGVLRNASNDESGLV